MNISEAVMFLVIFVGFVLCVAYFRASFLALRSRKGDRNSDGDSVA
jgi:hypothetical protein